MDVYIGFDISLQTTHVCAVDNEGKITQEGIAASDVSSLDNWLRTHGKDWTIKRIVFETGQLSTHLYHGLKEAGFSVVCIDARHAHGTLKAQRIKTDKNDARGLAQLGVCGADVAIAKSHPEAECWLQFRAMASDCALSVVKEQEKKRPHRACCKDSECVPCD